MPEEREIAERGIIDGADRMLKELIRTPRFKEVVTILLNSIDPPAARGLVRTLFWEDPVLFMSIFGALPAFANAAIEAAAEAAGQLRMLPAPLLEDFIERLAEGVDGATVGEAAGVLVSLVLSLNLDGESRIAGSLRALKGDFLEGYREKAKGASPAGYMDNLVKAVSSKAAEPGSATSAVIRAAGEAIAANPDFTEHVLRPLLGPAFGEPSAGKAPSRKAAGKKAARRPAGKRGTGKEG